jgi:hypothetical protein
LCRRGDTRREDADVRHERVMQRHIGRGDVSDSPGVSGAIRSERRELRSD